MELFHAAASGMRRFLGAAAEDTPLICPLGNATLSSPKDLRKVAAMMAALPALQSGLVLEIPSQALQSSGIMMIGASLLSDAGLRIALEGELPAADQAKIFEQFSFEFWSRRSADIALALASAGDARIIATDLSEDHQVIAMIDAGVGLVCGPRFSPPKPIRPRGASREVPVDVVQERKGSIV